MILVISSENDISTDYFMEWSRYLKMNIIRLNEKESLNIIESILLNNDGLDIHFNIQSKCFKLSEVTAVWFRRGYLYHFSKLQYDSNFAEKERNSITNFLKNESTTLNDFVIYSLMQKKHLNDPNHYNANKLITLFKASEIGLRIPNSLITKNKEKVEFIFNGQRIITKSIQDALTINENGFKFAPGVHEIQNEDLNMCKHFYYSKFQIRIEKKYELRIFFIDNDYYAGAIFSNNNLIQHRLHKIVPFLLPEDVLAKLRLLNKGLGYKSGSIDMIVDNTDAYYFLEINPVGQYDYLSKHCNFHLDFITAQYFNNKNE